MGRTFVLLLFVAVALPFASPSPSPSPLLGCYSRIFSFGDSLTDTGNLRAVVGPNSTINIAHPPFGNTFFGRPTGRYCDGRLIVDFLTRALGLPFLRPYLADKTSTELLNGANFAVAGAVAAGDHWANMTIQLGWFKDLLRRACSDSGEDQCGDLMASSLFLMGEIGGNDYNYPLLNRKPLSTIEALIPSVIYTISSAVEELIEMGAKTVVVPGNLPIGCVPKYLTYYRSEDAGDYEPDTGCLRWMNDFSRLHNEKLLAALEALRARHPDVTIIYADYFGAMMEIFIDPERFGLANPLVACCGAKEGPYNCSIAVECDEHGATVCDDPRKAASWDGFHPTEAAYEVIAQGVLYGQYSQPSIEAHCAQEKELQGIIELEAHKAALYDSYL